ncbi:hypothetical protein [Nostoc sp.]
MLLSSIHSAIASNNKIYQRSVDDESGKIGKNWTAQNLLAIALNVLNT